MGISIGGIAFKTDTSKVELLKVVKDLFGNNFEKSAIFCDSRINDCVYVGKTKEFLVIVNSDFASKFFKSQKAESIQKYLDYFSNPEFVFAFEEYDSGGTYSYSLINNGIITRQFRSLSYNTKVDFGKLEQAELKWKNAEIIKEDLGEGEFQILYKDPERDFSCSEEQLPQVMLQELMYEKLGFASWNMDEFIFEQGHYKNTHIATTKNTNQTIIKQDKKEPWWKLW